jgi:general secretion pathway protein D
MKYFFALLLLISQFSLAAEPEPTFSFISMPVNQAANLIFNDALKVPYILSPDIVKDDRAVSFRSPPKGLAPYLVNFFDQLGYKYTVVSGLHLVQKRTETALPAEESILHVYRPKNRESGYLARLIAPVFKNGRFTQSKQIQAPVGAALVKDVPATSAAGAIEQNADVLIFSGSQKEIDQLKNLYAQIDLPSGEISVRAVIYEVSSSKADGSAFQLLTNLLGTQIGISSLFDASLGVAIDKGGIPSGNALTIKFKGFEAVLSALSTDNRFNVITQPRIRVKSGETAKLTVGQDVPVLGSVSYQNNNAIRSVDYRSAGTILSIMPQIKDDLIDLAIEQQLSNFVRTDTGVNESPTLIKRELKTSISAHSGDIVVLGGLTETKKTNTKRGFSFLPFSLAKTDDESSTDVIVILQIEKI